MVNPRNKTATRDRGIIAVHGNRCVGLPAGKKRPVPVIPHGGKARRAYAKALPPGLDPEKLVIVSANQPAVLCAQCHRCISFSPFSP